MQARSLFLIAIGCLFVAHCRAEIYLNAGVAQASPDGRLVQVNGGIFTTTGNVLGWIYQWGDGQTTDGFFPTLHRYTNAGTYSITLRGYTDLNQTTTCTFFHTVPSQTNSNIARVELSKTAIGIKTNEIGIIDVRAFGSDGAALPIAEGSITCLNLNPEICTVAVQDNRICVTPSMVNREIGLATIYVYVENQECQRPLSVSVNCHEGSFRLLAGRNVVMYLPDSFFTNSHIPEAELIQIADAIWEEENAAVGNTWLEPGKVLQGVGYIPPVYGSSGNPLALGDSAIPSANNNYGEYIGLLIHEMGHNFQASDILYSSIAIPGAYYQETLSEWYVQYVLNNLIAKLADTLSPGTLRILSDLRSKSLDAHRLQMVRYLASGKRFDYLDCDSGSQPLLERIYQYSQTYGWGRLTNYFNCFGYQRMPLYASVLAKYGGLGAVSNRVTIMACALSASFDFDPRPDFRQLNFPLNDALYNELTPSLPQTSPASLALSNAPGSASLCTLRVDGLNGFTHVVEASTNLSDWRPIYTNKGSFNLSDSIVGASRCSYRTASNAKLIAALPEVPLIPPGQTLNIGVDSLDGVSGAVTINGGETRGDTQGTFHWDWGDGCKTTGWFPQMHTYTNLSSNYVVTVTVSYTDGSVGIAADVVWFTP